MAGYDATTKFLIEHHAADWLALAGVNLGGRPVRVVDAELSTITSASDELVRVGRGRRAVVVHIEFQSGRDVDLDGRMAEYNLLARRRHGLPVLSVAFLLRPAAGPPAVRGAVRWVDDGGSPLTFDYGVVRVWQLPAERLLAGGLGTLPLAPIAAVGRGGVADVIGRMRRRLDREADPPRAAELWTATRILMGLRYDGPAVRALL